MPTPLSHPLGKLDAGSAELTFKSDLRELEYRLVIKLGAMTMAAVATVAALVKLL